jgi:hypothetical protein
MIGTKLVVDDNSLSPDVDICHLALSHIVDKAVIKLLRHANGQNEDLLQCHDLASSTE